MPLAWEIAKSQGKSSASLSLGSGSTGKDLPSLPPVGWSSVSYTNGLRKLRLLTAEYRPPPPLRPPLYDRYDSKDRHSHAFNLDRTAYRTLEQFDQERDEQTQACSGEEPPGDNQRTVRPVWAVW